MSKYVMMQDKRGVKPTSPKNYDEALAKIKELEALESPENDPDLVKDYLFDAYGHLHGERPWDNPNHPDNTKAYDIACDGIAHVNGTVKLIKVYV